MHRIDFNHSRFRRAPMAVAAAFLAVAAPAHAQDDDTISAELEALVDAGQSPEAAIAAARQQIGENNLSGAASTLERALIENRNADDVRALYATVLCRLDDPKGAQVEIDLLQGQNVSPALVSELQANCGLTPGALQASDAGDSNDFLRGGVMIGLQFDEDVAGATNLQFIPLFPPNATAFEDEGFAVLMSADLNARAPLGDGFAYGEFAIDTRFEISGPALGNGDYNYQIGKLRFGYGNSGENSEFQVGPLVRYTRLFGEDYLREVGLDASLTFQRENNRELILKGEAIYEDFTLFGSGNQAVAVVVPNLAQLRDGWNFDLSLASLKREDDGGYAYYGAGVEVKEADLRGFVAGRIFASALKPITEDGHYLKMTGVYRYVDFESRSLPLIPTALPRTDHRIYFRGAVGIPLGDEGIFFELGTSITARWSNAASQLFDYDSFGADARFIWRF